MEVADIKKCLWGATTYDGARLVYYDDDGEQTLASAPWMAKNDAYKLFSHIADLHNAWRIDSIDSIEEFLRVFDCEAEIKQIEAILTEEFGGCERELWRDPGSGSVALHFNIPVGDMGEARKRLYRVQQERVAPISDKRAWDSSFGIHLVTA